MTIEYVHEVSIQIPQCSVCDREAKLEVRLYAPIEVLKLCYVHAARIADQINAEMKRQKEELN